MQQRVSIITLGVSDLSRSRAFYESLGWRVATEEQAQNIVAFNLPGMVLALYPLAELAREVPVTIPERPQATFTLAYNVGSQAQVEATMTDAEQVGAEIIKPPQQVFWGGYSGYFRDPDGYLWEVAYNPFAVLGKNGEFRWVP